MTGAARREPDRLDVALGYVFVVGSLAFLVRVLWNPPLRVPHVMTACAGLLLGAHFVVGGRGRSAGRWLLALAAAVGLARHLLFPA